MNTANLRAASLLGRRRLDALLHGCVRAFACITLLVLLAVTLWLPASSLAASFAEPGELGVSSAAQANKAGYPENDSSPVGLVQRAVGVYSVNNNNYHYCITPGAEFGEWCRLVQWTASSPFHSRTGAICLDRIRHRGEGMPHSSGILSPANRRGDLVSQHRKADASYLELPNGGISISSDYRAGLKIPNHLHRLNFGLQT